MRPPSRRPGLLAAQEADGDHVTLTLTSADGDMGFPGNCKVTFPNLDKDAWEKA